MSRPKKEGAKTRSRTGCQDCKRRKIKCDETKPSCEHCKRSGLDCDYRIKLRWDLKSTQVVLTPATPATTQTPDQLAFSASTSSSASSPSVASTSSFTVTPSASSPGLAGQESSGRGTRQGQGQDQPSQGQFQVQFVSTPSSNLTLPSPTSYSHPASGLIPSKLDEPRSSGPEYALPSPPQSYPYQNPRPYSPASQPSHSGRQQSPVYDVAQGYPTQPDASEESYPGHTRHPSYRAPEFDSRYENGQQERSLELDRHLAYERYQYQKNNQNTAIYGQRASDPPPLPLPPMDCESYRSSPERLPMSSTMTPPSTAATSPYIHPIQQFHPIPSYTAPLSLARKRSREHWEADYVDADVSHHNSVILPPLQGYPRRRTPSPMAEQYGEGYYENESSARVGSSSSTFASLSSYRFYKRARSSEREVESQVFSSPPTSRILLPPVNATRADRTLSNSSSGSASRITISSLLAEHPSQMTVKMGEDGRDPRPFMTDATVPH